MSEQLGEMIVRTGTLLFGIGSLIYCVAKSFDERTLAHDNETYASFADTEENHFPACDNPRWQTSQHYKQQARNHFKNATGYFVLGNATLAMCVLHGTRQ